MLYSKYIRKNHQIRKYYLRLKKHVYLYCRAQQELVEKERREETEKTQQRSKYATEVITLGPAYNEQLNSEKLAR